MNPFKLPLTSASRLALAVAIATGAAGCAPSLGDLASIKPFSHYATEQSLKTPIASWPSEQWWLAYNDSQLNTLIAEALQGTPDLATAQARLKQAEARAIQANAALLPAVSANADYSSMRQSYNNGAPANATPQGWNDSARATLDFSYEIDFWGRNRAAVAAATSDLEAARADAAQAQIVLTTSVAAAYAELAQEYADRDAAEAALNVRTQTANLFAQRETNGLENIGSVKQAQALESTAKAEIAALDESIGLTRNRIAALLGQGPDRGLTITHPTIDLSHGFGLPQNLPLELLGHRPDVQAARLRAESAASHIKEAKAGFYPNVNLTGYFGRQVLGLQYLDSSDSTIGGIGPAINLPLFNRGQLKGAYKSAAATYEEAVATYDATLTHAFQDVADVAVSRKALDDRLAFSQQAVTDAEQAWNIAQQRYKAGLSNYLSVLTAEDTLIQNRRTYANLQARAFTLDINLMRALGGGYRSQSSTQVSSTTPVKE